MEKLLLELESIHSICEPVGFADSLRGPGKTAQSLCGVGCHAAAMTLIVMR